MTQRAISISTVAYDGYSIETALGEIAALGLPLVEPAYIKGYMDFDESAFSDSSAVKLCAQMNNAGVKALAISAHMDIGDQNAIAMLERRICFTAAIGAKITITNSTTGDKQDSLKRTIAANLPFAQQLGVTIALENPGHGTTNLMRDAASGAKLIQSFASPWLRFNYDTGNALTCSEGDVRPEIDIDIALPLCCHVHLKDVARVEESWRYTAVGDGEIDYAILKRKLQSFPTLPLTLELPLRLNRHFHKDPVRDEQLVPLATIRQAIMKSLCTVKEF